MHRSCITGKPPPTGHREAEGMAASLCAPLASLKLLDSFFMRPRLSATEASLDRLNELTSRSAGDKSSHIGGGGGNDLVLNALPV